MISVTRSDKCKEWSYNKNLDIVIVFYEKDEEELSTKRLLRYGQLFKDTTVRIVAVSLSTEDTPDTHWKFLIESLDMYDNFSIPLISDPTQQLASLLNYATLTLPNHAVLIIKDGNTVFQGHFDATTIDLELMYAQQHAMPKHIYLSDYY